MTATISYFREKVLKNIHILNRCRNNRTFNLSLYGDGFANYRQNRFRCERKTAQYNRETLYQ